MITNNLCILCRKPIDVNEAYCKNCGADQRRSNQGNPRPYEAVDNATMASKVEKKQLHLRLVSGKEYVVRAFLLFDKEALQEAQTLKSRALQKLGGFSSGIGAIGNLGHVLTTAFIVSALEGKISNHLQSEGIKMIEESEKLIEESRKKSYYFELNLIKNIEMPIPDLWQAVVAGVPEKLYVHNGDPMTIVLLDNYEILSIIWDKLETYQIVNTQLPAFDIST